MKLKRLKQEAKDLLTSELGLIHKGKRCIEPETVFGQMKYDFAYERFRHWGKNKVWMDFDFFAIASNTLKMSENAIKDRVIALVESIIEGKRHILLPGTIFINSDTIHCSVMKQK